MTSLAEEEQGKKRCKTFIKRKRWWIEHCSDDASVATTAAERPFFVFFLKDFRSLMKSV